MIFGVDQSLSNTGIIKLSLKNKNDQYFIDLKNVLISLRNLINTFNIRKKEYLAILGKCSNKTFSFQNEIKKSKYSEKEKTLLLTYIEELQNKKNDFEKYISLKDFSSHLFSLQQTENTSDSINLDEYFNIEHLLISPKSSNTERLSFYKSKYAEIISDNKANIDVAVIEGYSYGSSATQSIFELGELAGQFKCINYENQIETIIIPPSTLKKVIVGKGNVKKPEINAFFSNHLNYNFNIKKADDLYDALGLSLFVMIMPYLNTETLLKIKFND